MIPSLPLLEKKVLVPRGEQQAKSFSELVEHYGGIPMEIPLIAFRPIERNEHLQKVLRVLDTYNWIIFTSGVTVETFFSFVDEKLELSHLKIAVIGKKTKEILSKKGIDVNFVPSAYVAEVFAEEFLPYIDKGTRVLIPKGNLAREYIADRLRDTGADVDEVVIYETYMPETSRSKLAELLKGNQLDILLFTSPSTVDHLMQVVHEFGLHQHLEQCTIGCIGPSTEKKLREYGLPVHGMPSEYTVKGMIHSTIAFLEQNNLEK